MNHKISEMLSSSLAEMQKLVDVNSIVGQPIHTPEGVTIIPVSRVRIGMGGGGSDFATKHSVAKGSDPFGGGMGCGVNIDPVAFLVIRGENVRLMPVAEPASTTVDRIVEIAPEILDKIADFIDSRKEKKEAE